MQFDNKITMKIIIADRVMVIVNYPAHRVGHLKKLKEGDCILHAPAPHSSPSTGRGVLRVDFIKNNDNGLKPSIFFNSYILLTSGSYTYLPAAHGLSKNGFFPAAERGIPMIMSESRRWRSFAAAPTVYIIRLSILNSAASLTAEPRAIPRSIA